MSLTTQGTLLGVAAAVVCSAWLAGALLLGPGATWRVLLPALLFVLPVLAIGAAAGWLAGTLISLGPRLRH